MGRWEEKVYTFQSCKKLNLLLSALHIPVSVIHNLICITIVSCAPRFPMLLRIYSLRKRCKEWTHKRVEDLNKGSASGCAVDL